MELKTFIHQTLVQIIDAVVEARSHAQANGAMINPHMGQMTSTMPNISGPPLAITRPNFGKAEGLGMFLTEDNRTVEMIEFDVAVMGSSTTEEMAKTGGGGKVGANIKVVSVDIGGETSTSSGLARTDERVSHVRFRIPVALPQQSIST